jgi:parvulin-like peptidyl-prolyl isomerase
MTVREYTMEAILYRDHIFKSLATTDDEVKAYYESHKVEFQSPARRRVAQILVATEAEAKALRVKLDGGADFETLAKQSSRDFVTAQKGGDLGWITADKVPPSFAEILTMKAGQISKPVSDTAGWHIIKVLETEEQTLRGFEDVKEQVKNRVLDNRKRAIRAEWVGKLRAVSKIEIDDAAIKAFVAANQFDEKAAPPQHGLQ